MRSLDQLPIVKDSDPKFPFGATIQNETDTQDGTAVVRELYGDIIQNLYQLVKIAGMTPTGDEDSDDTQYQIIEALKKFANDMNDVEQVLSLSGTQWSLQLPFDILPNKYVCIARTDSSYNPSETYTIIGNDEDETEYAFESPSGFLESTEVLIIIDQSGVRAYSLSKSEEAATELLIGLGIPLAFNDTAMLRYQEEGNLLSDIPSVQYLESVLRVESGFPLLLVNDILILKGYILCFCWIPEDDQYAFWQFPQDDISSPSEVDIAGYSMGTADDFMPYVYTNGDTVWLTNGANTTADDFELVAYSFDGDAQTLTFASAISIDTSFQKTSNAVLSKNLYTFYDGILTKFPLGVPTTAVILGEYNGVSGNLFSFNGGFYFSTGDVAKLWDIGS